MRLWVPSILLALCSCQGGKDAAKDTGPGPVVGATGTASNPSSRPPSAQDDAAAVDEGGIVSISVAANDLVTTFPLALGSVTVVDPPSNGTVLVNANGVVDYTHGGGETVSDHFTYWIEDETGEPSNLASVSVVITPVNDLPIAGDDSAAVVQGGSIGIGLLVNDSDADDGLDLSSITIVDPPAYGSLTDAGNGTMNYVHDGAGVPYDGFTYTVSDLSGAVSNVATVDLSVSTTNVPPIAVDDFVFVAEGGIVNAVVLYNDFDFDDGIDPASVTIVGAPAFGATLVHPDGTIDYLHDGSETVSDSFTYRVYDLSGAPSNITSVQLGISPINDAPTAVDDAVVVDEGMSTNVVVLANDIDPDNALDPLTVTLGTLPTYGTAIVTGNGSIDYSHDGTQVVSDSFTYYVDDAVGAVSNQATVDVFINLVNDPPIAGDDAGFLNEGGSLLLYLSANDTDADDGLDLGSIQIISAPSSGSVLVYGDGTVQYDNDGSETISDSFAYTISDTIGFPSNIALVTLGITPVNDLPIAVDDNFVVAEGSVNNLQNILTNDSDADDGLNNTSVVIDSAPTHGNVFVYLNGTTEYTHDGTNTVADSYTYHVLDNSGASSNVATVNIVVGGVNDPPVAGNDTVLLDEGGSVNVDVLANDTDSDNGIDPTTTQVITAPINGSALVLPDGSIDYTHDGSETLGDSFTYLVRDLAGLTSNAATVTVVVNTVNDPPTAVDDSAVINEGGGTSIPILANDFDPDGSVDPASILLVSLPANGSAVLVGTSLSYTHDGSETVSDTVTYTVRDLAGLTSNAATVSISVTPVNDLPVAVDDSGGSVDEGAGKNVAVLSNDSDVDDGLDPSSVTVVGAPANGSAVVLGDGSITYTHNGSETLSDSFSYTVDDFAGGTSNAATVVFAVNPVNDPPVGVTDGFSLDEGAARNLAILDNDSDADDGLDATSVTVTNPPVNGTFLVLANGTVDYTHNGSNTLTDSFTYRVSDYAGALSGLTQVNLTINPVNDLPVASNDAGNVNEGAGVNLNLAANDSDSDDGLDLASIRIVGAPANGNVAVNANGTVDYTHNGSETVGDSFTYTIDDNSGAASNTATVSITVNPVNDLPVAGNDPGISLPEGGMVNIDVLANDSDADDGLDTGSVTITGAGPANGTAVVLGNGTIDYTHNGGQTVSDSFTYTVRDNSGATSNTATVNLVISNVNDPPVASNDSGNVNEGSVVNLNLAANDNDIDDGLDLASIAIISAPSNGGTAVNANGTVDYTHNGSETVSDSFTYRINDLSGAASNTATVSITVNPVNDPPIAVNDSGVGVNEGALVNISVLSNDTDADDGLNSGTVTVVSGPSNGSAVAQPNGTINYTHNGGETASDSFTYIVRDNAGVSSNTATVSLVINPVNDPPVASNDSGNVNEGALVNLNLASNDSDPDDGLNLGTISIIGGASNGSTAVQGNGTVNYTHNGGETVSDSFTYKINDNSGVSSNTATVSITINPVNDPPVAVNDSGVGVNEGGLVNISVLANDSDVDDGLNASTVTVVSNPTRGSAVPQANGTINYTHNGGETVSDSFTYRVKDNSGVNSNTATVSITITPVNDPPVAVVDSYAVDEGSVTDLNVLANDSDVDDGLSPGTIQIMTAPVHGTAAPQATGVVRYTHDGSNPPSDSFTYRVADFSGANSNTVTVNLTINSTNDPPVTAGDSANVNEGALVNIPVLSNDTDPDDGINPASVQISGAGPSRGSAVVQPNGTINYTHNGGETASDSFSYTVRDYYGDTSNSSTVSITINPVNDAPVAVGDSYGTPEGSMVDLSVLSNDSDADDGINPNTITVISAPSYGTAAPNVAGQVRYTHDGSETVSDSFTYRVKDYAGTNSNTVTVNLAISPVNDPPVANPDYEYIGYIFYGGGGSYFIQVAANDFDADDGLDLNSIVITQQPNNGFATSVGNGEIRYNQFFGYYGFFWDTIEYTIQDYSGAVSNPTWLDVEGYSGGYCNPFCP